MNSTFIKFAIKIAIRNVRIRKTRTILTVLAVTYSVATLIALRTVGIGVHEKIASEIRAFLRADIIISEESVVIPEGIVNILESELKHVDYIIPAILVTGKLGVHSTSILAVEKEGLEKLSIELSKGTFFKSEECYEIILEEELAHRMGINEPGGEVILSINVGNLFIEKKFKIIGIAKRASSLAKVMGFTIAIVPLPVLQDMLGREGFINHIFVKVSSDDMIEAVSRDIKTLFPRANLIKQTEVIEAVSRILDIIRGTLSAVTLVGLLVAALGVMNTVMMSIRERIHEIGVLKAIGASGLQVMTIFLSEVLAIGLSGGALGCIVGYWGSHILRRIIIKLGLPFDIPILIVPEVYAWGIFIAISVSIVAALYPISYVLRIRPVEALRFE
ncbi:MAG: hypothetical protein DRJ49_04880 [Thermoprotei archaeon]|nr:MAG: hypothetical protein DRN53_02030 [Thermoprotei archaeon]RLE88523.1 MAG: hypothetical protein DRJ49_04880 [Thermoprotei archaeon]